MLIIGLVNEGILKAFCHDFCGFLRGFGKLISESLYSNTGFDGHFKGVEQRLGLLIIKILRWRKVG
jgi:hypothetical protein